MNDVVDNKKWNDFEFLVRAAFVDGAITQNKYAYLLKEVNRRGIEFEKFESLVRQLSRDKHNPFGVTDKEGVHGVRRCPSCGAIVSFQAKCPECGYAFDNIEASSSVKDLFEELQRIGPRNIARKKQILEAFPVPNSKKDLLDFMIMLKPMASDYRDRLANTYLKKYAECIEKSKTFFLNDNDFKPFIDCYETVRNESNKGKVGRWVAGNKVLIITLSVLVIGLLFLIVCWEKIEPQDGGDFIISQNQIIIPSSGSSQQTQGSVFEHVPEKDKTFSASGKKNGHEYIDLGLSVKWATMNIGAKGISNPGYYYAWGETKPKDQYYWVTYFDTDNGFDFNKYTIYKKDGLTTLSRENDVASVLWGDTWRMPTLKELKELLENSTASYCTVGDISGIRFESNINSKSIFIPKGGYMDKEMINDNENGYLWTSSLDLSGVSDCAYGLKCGFLGYKVIWSEYRCVGLPVRAVTP